MDLQIPSNSARKLSRNIPLRLTMIGSAVNLESDTNILTASVISERLESTSTIVLETILVSNDETSLAEATA